MTREFHEIRATIAALTGDEIVAVCFVLELTGFAAQEHLLALAARRQGYAQRATALVAE